MKEKDVIKFARCSRKKNLGPDCETNSLEKISSTKMNDFSNRSDINFIPICQFYPFHDRAQVNIWFSRSVAPSIRNNFFILKVRGVHTENLRNSRSTSTWERMNTCGEKRKSSSDLKEGLITHRRPLNLPRFMVTQWWLKWKLLYFVTQI